ncbi:unnamed protein product, partial [Adineta ricciae]
MGSTEDSTSDEGKVSANQNNTCDDDEQETKLQEKFEYALQSQELLRQSFKSSISGLSADNIIKLLKELYEFQMKSDEIEKSIRKIEQDIHDGINDEPDDWREHLNQITNHHDDGINAKIEQLTKDIDEQKLKLQEINNHNKKLSCPLLNVIYTPTSDHSQSYPASPNSFHRSSSNSSRSISSLLIRQMSPAVLDLNNDENDSENEEEPIDPNKRPQIDTKIHLANNIVSCLRGPFKIVATGPLSLADALAKGRRVQETIIEAVRRKATEQQPTDHSIKTPFIEITSDWKYEGVNEDAGFNSPSIWMRNPKGRRVLVKTQDLPICAANEWLAYAIGLQIGLPINEVQIAVHEEKLVTLHVDVAHDDEKCVTFLHLPKQRRKKLLTDPILGSMYLFDHIIQNVDRNARNILITIPKSADIEDETTLFKLHLIDHALCFG